MKVNRAYVDQRVMMQKMRYRLALDLGSTSLGWAMLRLNTQNEPCAVIKAGVRIFSDGRNPKDGSSLAVSRREARAMRRPPPWTTLHLFNPPAVSLSLGVNLFRQAEPLLNARNVCSAH